MAASIIWGGLGIWQIYRTEFLAGFWGITNDEIAVVTIEKDGDDNEDMSTETIIIQDPSKSFWDGLQLLGVPLVLAVLGAWFQKTQQEQAEQVAKDQREQNADETREEVLQLYFDRISTLLIDKNLMAIASKDTALSEEKEILEASLDVIRARTLSILRRFRSDSDRKSSVIRFLAEADMISRLKLNLEGACLHGVILKGVSLKEANLQKADLSEANFQGANLYGTQLHEAQLHKAILSEANLNHAILERASLEAANLKGTFLGKASFKEANLNHAVLEGAILNQAILTRTTLTEVNLKGAVLKGANLNQANLSKVNLYGANLEGAKLDATNLEGTNLDKILFNTETIWPKDKREVAKAKNIPIKLQKQLGLIPDPPQKPPTDQKPPKPPR